MNCTIARQSQVDQIVANHFAKDCQSVNLSSWIYCLSRNSLDQFQVNDDDLCYLSQERKLALDDVDCQRSLMCPCAIHCRLIRQPCRFLVCRKGQSLTIQLRTQVTQKMRVERRDSRCLRTQAYFVGRRELRRDALRRRSNQKVLGLECYQDRRLDSFAQVACFDVQIIALLTTLIMPSR